MDADEQENWSDHEIRLSASHIMMIRKIFSRWLPENQDVRAYEVKIRNRIQ